MSIGVGDHGSMSEEEPVFVDVAGEVWEELEKCPTWSLDDFWVRLGRVGRVNGPALLSDALGEGAITRDILTATIGDVWSMAEYPDRCLDPETWRTLFVLAGYTVDGTQQPRPSEPLRLYRGSVPDRRADWSWTDNREVAARYASGTWYQRPTGVIWTADVDPDRLLARNTERNESEYVVDTFGLEIVEDGT